MSIDVEYVLLLSTMASILVFYIRVPRAISSAYCFTTLATSYFESPVDSIARLFLARYVTQRVAKLLSISLVHISLYLSQNIVALIQS